MDYLKVKELYHHGVKGMKWGIINENDSEKTRLEAEKDRLKYDYKNNEAHMFYGNQAKKDKMDYKRDVKLAKINERINKGKQHTDRAISRNERLGTQSKYRALGIAAVSAALAASSVGSSYALGQQAKGMSDTYTTIKNDNRSNYSENKTTNNIGNTTTKIDRSKFSNKQKSYAKYSEDLDILLDDVLCYSGIKGMKWGVRRFQKPDGTLTEEGKLRYNETNKEVEKQAKDFLNETVSKYPNLTDEEKSELYYDCIKKAKSVIKQKHLDADKSAIATAETGKQILEGTSNVFFKAGEVVPHVEGANTHPDYSNMSTEDLINKTNRLNAENNYARASGEMKYTPSKQEVLRERLQTIGSVAGVLAAVGNIVVPIVKLKHWNGDGGGKQK